MKNKNQKLIRFIFTVIMTCLFLTALIMIPAWNFKWLEGWTFSLWWVLMIVLTLVYMYRKDPELLAERSKPVGEGSHKKWDAILLSLIYLLAIAWLVMMPLDTVRFHWSPAFPLWLKIIGGLLLVPALYFIYKATADNTFLSARVRIQDDRKQHVITTGTYAFVRHPLYFGCVCLILGGPLLLGSLVGLGLSILAVTTLVVRIVGEEKMLVNELEGYAEYKKKVKYRLIPFIW
jgi:protein-S-isoprenylcysteine O-methyltransferase Ste14